MTMIHLNRKRLTTRLTFFMIPAFRFEKVMCRRDLSWMNLISIFRRSRPGLSSSSSSSSAAMRDRFTPLGPSDPDAGAAEASLPLPLLAPMEPSSRAGDWGFWSWSVISAAISLLFLFFRSRKIPTGRSSKRKSSEVGLTATKLTESDFDEIRTSSRDLVFKAEPADLTTADAARARRRTRCWATGRADVQEGTRLVQVTASASTNWIMSVILYPSDPTFCSFLFLFLKKKQGKYEWYISQNDLWKGNMTMQRRWPNTEKTSNAQNQRQQTTSNKLTRDGDC